MCYARLGISLKKCLVCSFDQGVSLASSQNCEKFKYDVISMNETEGYTGIYTSTLHLKVPSNGKRAGS